MRDRLSIPARLDGGGAGAEPNRAFSHPEFPCRIPAGTTAVKRCRPSEGKWPEHPFTGMFLNFYRVFRRVSSFATTPGALCAIYLDFEVYLPMRSYARRLTICKYVIGNSASPFGLSQHDTQPKREISGKLQRTLTAGTTAAVLNGLLLEQREHHAVSASPSAYNCMTIRL
ncbi:hypothetical protein [Azospirillum palustre]